ncbi:MAG: potassium channel family protein [Bdellovibrionales bacterium]
MLTKLQKFSENIVENSSNKEKISFFDKLCISIIFLDAVLICLETFSSLSQFKMYFHIAIWFITSFFMVEYCIRILGSKNKLAFIKSPFGIVDLMSFLPMLLTLGEMGLSYIRIFRLIKFLKFTKYMKSSQIIWDSMRAIKNQILGFFMVGGIFVYIFSISMFHFESAHQPEKINNIMDSIYLAMVTITTLGYGDITPVTVMGRLTVIGFAFISVLFITVPTSLFLGEYQNKLNEQKEKISSLPKKRQLKKVS